MQNTTSDSRELLRYVDPRFQKIIIFPTTACNFRCTYCPQDHAPARMSPDVVRALQRFLKRRRDKGLQILDMEFFGGEPTLELDTVVLPLALFARDLGIERFAGTMTTNFYKCTPTVFATLIDAGVRAYQVTLGPAQLHDSTRVLCDGSPTYECIHANVMAAHRSSFQFDMLLRLHYTPDTWPLVGQFAGDLANALDSDPRFRFHFHPISRLGGPNDAAIAVVSDESANFIETQLASCVPQHMASPISRDSYVCYACTSSLAVNTDGTLYKCTVYLENRNNHIGRLLPDGTIAADQHLHQLWLAPIFSDGNARRCPYRWLAANIPGFDSTAIPTCGS